MIGAVDAVVSGLADEVDAEGDEGNAQARGSVAEVVGEHRVLTPLVPPPEKLSRRSQRLPHYRLRFRLRFLISHAQKVRVFFFPSGLHRREKGEVTGAVIRE